MNAAQEIAWSLSRFPMAKAAQLLLHVIPWGMSPVKLSLASLGEVYHEMTELLPRTAPVDSSRWTWAEVREVAETLFRPLAVPDPEQAIDAHTFRDVSEGRALLYATNLPLDQDPCVRMAFFLRALPVPTQARILQNLDRACAREVQGRMGEVIPERATFQLFVTVSALARLIGQGRVDFDTGWGMTDRRPDELKVDWESVGRELGIWMRLPARPIPKAPSLS